MGAASAAIGGVQTGLGLFGAYEESQALKAEGKYQRQQAYAQADLLDLKAKDIKSKGGRDALRTKNQARSVGGSQRAALAAQGIDVSSGSAADILDETHTYGELDAMTVKNNAWREAFGYKTEAANDRLEGENAYRAGRIKSRQTLLTGGLNAVVSGAQTYRGLR